MTNPGSVYDAGMKTTVETLMSGLIDYAGLFPPAACDMPTAAANFARDRAGLHAFALNRFICTAGRLDELTEHARVLMPGTYATSGYREMTHIGEPWRISVVCDRPLDETRQLIDAFNARHAAEDSGLAVADAIELKAKDAAFIDDAIEQIPEDIRAFFEIPLGVDFRGMIAALAGNPGIGAKVRCGGVEPGMIPSTERVAAFIAACAASDVPFKATAGLHHPVRAEQNLTYDPHPPRAVMHGFLNVFIAAALARSLGLHENEIKDVLDETDPTAFVLTDTHAGWRDRRIDPAQLALSRSRFCIGYGSCSFTEPIEDLRRLGLL